MKRSEIKKSIEITKHVFAAVSLIKLLPFADWPAECFARVEEDTPGINYLCNEYPETK